MSPRPQAEVSPRASLPPSGRAPCFLRQFYHQTELCLLDFRRDRIAHVDAGEAALWAHGKALEWDEAARFLQSLLERDFVLDHRGFGRDEAEHDRFLLW